jgi:hypothetical protein
MDGVRMAFSHDSRLFGPGPWALPKATVKLAFGQTPKLFLSYPSARNEWHRFVCLTNGPSNILKHYVAMQAIFVAWYNFARKDEALKGRAPAMASALSDHIWTIKELIERVGNAWFSV